MEPREVSGLGGKRRWIGADGRSYETLEEARRALPVPPVLEPTPARPLRLFHLVSEAAFLKWPKSAWIRARTAEHAIELWVTNFLRGGVAPTSISVFDYLENWTGGEVPEREGFISLEHPMHRVATFDPDEQRRILREGSR